MPRYRRLVLLVAVITALWIVPTPGFADALVKPLPQPDTSNLKPDQAKQLAEARAAFEKQKINLIGDGLATAYAKIGAIYARMGLNDVAAIAMYDASKLAPKHSAWLYLRGVIARQQNRNQDARADFEAALALDKTYLPIRYRLADTLVDLGEPDAAHKLLIEALPKHKDDATLLSLLGRLEIKEHNYAAAVTHLQAALKAEPQANALYKDLATAYTGQGDADSARRAQAKAGNRPPDLNDPLVASMYSAQPQLHGTPLQQARQLLAQRKFRRARAKVAEAVLANPKNVDALALAARIDALLGNEDAARKGAEQALKLAPNSAMANLSRGMAYEFSGDGQSALSYYRRALSADPTQPDAHLLLGNALMRRGDYAAAAEQYRRLASIDPGGSDVDAHLAAALVAQGRCAEALKHVNASLAKRPKDGELMQVFVRLASTCKAATTQERSMALDYAQALYKQRPSAGDTTALALAQAAHGKFEDAQQSQAEAIYEAVRLGDAHRAGLYRETMRQFAAKKVPDMPWPSGSDLFKPPLLQPLPPAPAKGGSGGH